MSLKVRVEQRSGPGVLSPVARVFQPSVRQNLSIKKL